MLVILLINNTVSYSSSLKQFLQKQLKINLQSVDKLSLGQQGSENGRFNVEIVEGRKTVKVVVDRNENGEWNVVFMEKVATFGNGKSFLNIKTSTGLRYENTVSVQQQLPQTKTKVTERLFPAISIPSFHLPLQNIKELSINFPSSVISNSMINKIKKLIIQRLPEASLESIKVVEGDKTNQWSVETEIADKIYKMKVKEQNGNKIDMDESKEMELSLGIEIVGIEQISTMK